MYQSRSQRRQDSLAIARSVTHGEHHRRDNGGARRDYPRDMENSLQNLTLDEIREEKMMIGQVDGLVDYSSSEDDASKKLIGGDTPHLGGH